MKTAIKMAALALWGFAAFSQVSEAPFGLHRGMTKEEVISLIGNAGIQYSSGDLIVFSTAPRPLPGLQLYGLFISPEHGLLKIVASARDAELVFTDIQSRISSTYGTARTYSFVKTESGADEVRKERSAYWDLRASMPGHISVIALDAEESSEAPVYLTLSYEFEGWDAYVATRNAKP